MTGSSAIERLRSLLAAAADDPVARAIGGRAAAVGWATVELDRAALELGAALGVPASRFARAAPSSILGARCLVAPEVLGIGTGLVVLEPSTEGRLAASLARRAEGPVAVWLEVGDVGAAADTLALTGVGLSAGQSGPLGDERLLLGGPSHGPHRLLIERPGTIRA